MRGRVVYFGTPDESVVSLQALLDTGYEIKAVITRPDQP
ncbi:MAG: methionyl-tRNA formyltransferase, partial [Deltaproteobacteria bacterium]|nr:methionyl-tRNA formyltransferase [Deltaproteobacteria bacterium]